jgi:hypothetical protein
MLSVIMLNIIMLGIAAPFLASNGSAVVEAFAQDLKITGSIPATPGTGKGRTVTKCLFFSQ